MRRLRWCVIGAGSIGQRHTRNLLALKQEISAVVEPNTALHPQLHALGIQCCYTALNETVLGDSDVALVCTPTHAHLAAAVAAAAAGCHLFIEKPLADTTAGTDALIAGIRAHDRIAMVGCNMRFYPGPRLLKQVLDSGQIGTPHYARFEVGSYLPEWRPTQDHQQGYSAAAALGGGCVLDAIHEMDLACWFFGFPQAVHGSLYPGTALGITAEAQAESIWTYPAGPLISIHQSFLQRWRQRRCEIAGAEGTALWDNRERKVWLWDARRQQRSALADLNAVDPNQMYLDELQYFIGCIEQHQQPESDIRWAARVLAVALATKKASTPLGPIPAPEAACRS
jgi:predicted dehydrogenase